MIKYKELDLTKQSKDSYKEKYEGKVFPTNNFGDIEILEYISSKKVLVKFVRTGNTKHAATGNIKKGNVCDRDAPNLYGVGFTDIPSRVDHRLYGIWNGMLSRCYYDKYHEKYASYKGCEVIGEFKYLSKFIEWCSLQKGFDQEGFQLDKDILIKGNKFYSSETCCFVPKDLNTLLTHRRKDKGLYPVGVSYKPRINKYIAQISKFKEVIHLGSFDTPEGAFQAYKQAKEAYIKEVAELYKDQIDIRVYEALMKYEVDIND